MSLLTDVQQSRGTVVIKADIPVQIDNMSVQEAADMQGESPYDSFWMYTLDGPIDVRKKDLFTDLHSIDPKTEKNTVYRVFGNPESFEDSHSEIPVEKVVGT